MDTTVSNRVREIVADECGRNADEVGLDEEFYRDLGMDSLNMVSIAINVQDAFGLEISDAEVQEFKTVADIARFVSAHGK